MDIDGLLLNFIFNYTYLKQRLLHYESLITVYYYGPKLLTIVKCRFSNVFG